MISADPIRILFAAFGEIPDDQPEADLVDGVTQVVDDVHPGGQFDRTTEHVARQGHIPDRVDRPTDEHEAAQKVEAVSYTHLTLPTMELSRKRLKPLTTQRPLGFQCL